MGKHLLLWIATRVKVKRALFMIVISAVVSAVSVSNVYAVAAPSNAELYKMILELKSEQKKLRAEAKKAKAEALAAKEELAQAKTEIAYMQAQPSAPSPSRGQDSTAQEQGDSEYAQSAYESKDELWRIELDNFNWTMRNMQHEYGLTDIGGVQDRGAVGSVLSIEKERENGKRLRISGRPFGRGTPEFGWTYTGFDSTAGETYVGPGRATFVSSDNSENDDSDNINTLGVETITPDDRFTRAVASYDFNYRVHDVTLGKTIADSESFALNLTGGARYLDMDHDFRVTYSGGDFQTAFTSFETSDVRGAGLLLGSDLKWKIFPRLSANFGVKGGMVLGDIETQTFIPDDEPGVPTNVRYEERRVLPFIEAGASLTYSHPIGGVLFNATVGYEMVNWFNAMDSRTFTDSHMEAQNIHQTGDISMDGAYLRVGLSY